MKKADYDKIAGTYDATRSMQEKRLDFWVRLISERIGTNKGIEFLDLGCGTGRFTIPISQNLEYSVTGADSSREMLVQAKEKDKDRLVKWDIQNAMSLLYPNEYFDAVFMSHLLHHVDEPLNVLKECYRILKPSSIVLNRYGSMEDIYDDPEHRFFPGAIEIDKARTPNVSQVEELFRLAGFDGISSETFVEKTNLSGWDRLRKAELKYTSVLTLISQDAFEQGLKAFHNYVSENQNDSWLLTDKISLTTGNKL